MSAPVKILIVDDDPQFRQLLQLVLRRAEDLALVGEAPEGRTGIELSEQLRPDVVLLDLMMPGMDGFEALPLIKAAHPEIAIIVLTALDVDEAERALALGAAGVVEKRDIVECLEPAIRASVRRPA